jgi:uncharacterized protein
VIHRARERRAIAWKNGGGVTREVAAFPPGSDFDGFAWRISIAEVRNAGPFSQFAGIDRVMAVLTGSLSITLGDAAPARLGPDDPPLQFPGELAVTAEPQGAGATDLNLMTRRALHRGRLVRHEGHGRRTLARASEVSIVIPLQPAVLEVDGEQIQLEPLDAAQLSGPAACVLSPSAGAVAAVYMAEILAPVPR